VVCVGRSIMSAYIKKGSKLTVHLANQGNEHDYQVFIKTGSPPTETDYDYQMTRCVAAISLFMFTCGCAVGQACGGTGVWRGLE
jgi:hypothetical protein